MKNYTLIKISIYFKLYTPTMIGAIKIIHIFALQHPHITLF